jgi:hypothetical protein
MGNNHQWSTFANQHAFITIASIRIIKKMFKKVDLDDLIINYFNEISSSSTRGSDFVDWEIQIVADWHLFNV